MLLRSFPLRVAVVVGATVLGGFLSFGREAKSSLRPLFVNNILAAQPFRHMRPIHVRISSPGSVFTAGTTVAVGYTDSNGQATTWAVVGQIVESDPSKMVLLVEPKDIRKTGPLIPGPAATGTGTIVVTTASPATVTPPPGIAVGAINTGECP